MANKGSLQKLRTEHFKSCYHVFFISNPICGIVAAMFAEYFGIPKDRLVTFPLRNIDLLYISAQTITVEPRLTDRILEKVGLNSLGQRVCAELNKLNAPYVLYAPWYIPHIQIALKSSKCLGHAYIEEGQVSFKSQTTFPIGSELNLLGLQKKQARFAESKQYLFRDDALQFIRISPAAFSFIAPETCVTLDNFEVITKTYQPRLKGVKTIGIGPAPRRVPERIFENIYSEISHTLPAGSVLKIHPGYSQDPKKIERIRAILTTESSGTIALCHNNTIIEAEMMLEPKQLFGFQSSLQQYAQFFGSSYHLLQFPKSHQTAQNIID